MHNMCASAFFAVALLDLEKLSAYSLPNAALAGVDSILLQKALYPPKEVGPFLELILKSLFQTLASLRSSPRLAHKGELSRTLCFQSVNDSVLEMW